jgi:hypothetical protein
MSVEVEKKHKKNRNVFKTEDLKKKPQTLTVYHEAFGGGGGGGECSCCVATKDSLGSTTEGENE